jgi:protoheme IX farnesyltransferase
VELTFFTLLGGAFSAAGASAINQYIDRDRDRFMQRTRNRPIPSGKVAPRHGLRFGFVLTTRVIRFL